MNAREKILGGLRERSIEVPPLPNLPPEGTVTYSDRLAQFLATWEGVGGQAFTVGNRVELRERIGKLAVVRAAKKIACLVADVPFGNVRLADVTDPHTLDDLDVTIVNAAFGVAENAALWIDGRRIHQRAALFIAQHVVFTVAARDLCDNLHEAYERLSFSEPGFGVFTAGPSKTADIEQSLVIGAHGPRSAAVFVTMD